MREETPFRHRSIWHMVLAPTVWTFHFAIIYAMTAVACAKTGSPDIARIGIAVLTAVALLLIGIIAWRAWVQWGYLSGDSYYHDQPRTEHRKKFLGHAGFLLSIVSAIGVVFVALPAIFIGSCQ